MKNGVYRLRQFVLGFTAHVSAEETAVLDQFLTPAQRHLFERMPIDAQRHSLNVLYALRNASDNDLNYNADLSPDLAVAALLHDVGKVAAADAGAYLGLWMRGPMVVLEILSPALLLRLASSQPTPSWRYAIHVQNQHPHIGAMWAREAGCSALTCWLIAHHQDQHQAMDKAQDELQRRELLRQLQWADNRN